MTTFLWAALAAVALLWPAALAGPLDGIPLDTGLDPEKHCNSDSQEQ